MIATSENMLFYTESGLKIHLGYLIASDISGDPGKQNKAGSCKGFKIKF